MTPPPWLCERGGRGVPCWGPAPFSEGRLFSPSRPRGSPALPQLLPPAHGRPLLWAPLVLEVLILFPFLLLLGSFPGMYEREGVAQVGASSTSTSGRRRCGVAAVT